MHDLAKSIADLIFTKLEPELHQAMVERIISVSLEKWRTQFTGDMEIHAMIDRAIKEVLAGRYKPVLDYIADRKARDKVLRRAKQNGIEEKVIKALFEGMK